MSIETISPRQLYEQHQANSGIELIDVRTPAEFQEVHIDFARNVPLSDLEPGKLNSNGLGKDHPLYVVCRSGSRGKQACEKLHSSGFTKVVNVEGGTQAWDQAGYPVTRGKAVMSLERQVRIAAGSLVLIGVTLGVFVHPYWLLLSAFVGAGLVFAGVTDTCGMGLMLARMPWNQVKSKPAEQKSDSAECAAEKSESCCG